MAADLSACPNVPCSCTGKQVLVVTFTHSVSYCGFFLCFLLTAQVFILDDLDQCFSNWAWEAGGVSLGLSGGHGGWRSWVYAPHPCPLQLVPHLPVLYLRLWHKILYIHTWKIMGLGCRGNKPMTYLAGMVFENTTRTWLSRAGNSLSGSVVVATTLTSCSSPVSWPLEAGELAPGHDLAQRERSGIASIEGSQSQSQGLVLTITFVSRAYTKLSAKLQVEGS